jgi:hypothetical protein
MNVKELMVKFRYSLNRFDDEMKEYEQLITAAAKARSNQEQQKINGLRTVSDEKWATFIAEIEQKAEARFNSAADSFQLILDILQTKKPKTKKAKS